MRKLLNFVLKYITFPVLSIALIGGILSLDIGVQVSLKDENQATMVAKILSIGEKIEVEVIEGEYGASGIYWVITGEETVYEFEDGRGISANSLKAGDRIEITYSGQVMMSYPPQIVAKKIVLMD